MAAGLTWEKCGKVAEKLVPVETGIRPEGYKLRKVKNKLDERLNYIRSLILNMGAFVEKTISSTSDILLNKHPSSDIMYELQKREEEINTLQLKVSRVCFKILARESPVAGDLRLILAIVNANTDLERMGDLAFNIAVRAGSVQKDPILDESLRLFELMFTQVSKMVHKSLDAFVAEDEKLSRQILIQDDNVDKARNQIREGLEQITLSHNRLIKPCIDLIIIAGELERIADHATNIAEEVIFLKTGDDIRHQDLPDEDEYKNE